MKESILIAGLILLGSFAHEWPAEAQVSQPGLNQQPAGQNVPPTSATTANPTVPPTPHGPPAEDNQNQARSIPLPDGVTFFTGCLVVVGILQAALLCQSLKFSKQATRDSLRVAKRSMLSERPYLLVESASMVWPDNSPPQMEFTLKNYGKGPAYLDKINTRLQLLKATGDSRFPDGMPYPQHFTEYFPVTPLPRRVINPGDVVNFRTEKRPGDTVVSPISAIRDRIQPVGHGRVECKDIFDNEWETGFLWLFWAGVPNLPHGHPWASNRVEEGPRDRNYVSGPLEPPSKDGRRRHNTDDED